MGHLLQTQWLLKKFLPRETVAISKKTGNLARVHLPDTSLSLNVSGKFCSLGNERLLDRELVDVRQSFTSELFGLGPVLSRYKSNCKVLSFPPQSW